jgi:putative transposase
MLPTVRAGLVAEPEKYRWSSAAAHCGTAPPDEWLEMELWQQYWDAASWREYLAEAGAEAEAEAIRKSTHTGRPLGPPEFIERLERALGRRLTPQKGGRPEKRAANREQKRFMFDPD